MEYGYGSDESLKSASESPFFEERAYRRRGMDRMMNLNDHLINCRIFDNKYRNDVIVHDDDCGVLFSLDLHGFTQSSCKYAVNKFLVECQELKTGTANLIHGRGEVLSKLVPRLLDAKNLDFYEEKGYVTVHGLPGGRDEFGVVTEADEQEKEQAEARERYQRELQAQVAQHLQEKRDRERKKAEELKKIKDDEKKRLIQERRDREQSQSHQHQDQGCLVILMMLSSSVLAALALLFVIATSAI